MTDFSVYLLDPDTFEKEYIIPVTHGEFDIDLMGGCGLGNFKFHLPFDGYLKQADLQVHRPVRVDVLDNALWQGYITQVNPHLDVTGDELEWLSLVCDGWVQWLKHNSHQYKYRKGQPALSGRTITRYSDIVHDIFDMKVAGDTRSQITKGRIDDSDEMPDLGDEGPAEFTMTMLQSPFEAIAILAKLAGNWQWGVSRNREFYFYPAETAIAYHVVVGRHVKSFSPTRDSSKLVNAILIRGGTGKNPSMEEYRFFNIRRDDDSIAEWGEHFAVRNQPEVNDMATALRYAQAVFEELAQPQDRVKLVLAPNYGLFEPYLGRVHIFSPPEEHYYYSITRTQYKIDDTGLYANPELGNYPPSLSAEIERLKIEVQKLQKEGAAEEFYLYDDNWNITNLRANLACALDIPV